MRYGVLGYVGEFRYGAKTITGCGERVVVQTNRGIEIGQVVSLTCSGCERSINRQQMVAYAEKCGADVYLLKAGRILRKASPQDLHEEARINADALQKLEQACAIAEAKNLPMKFVACEHLFGGERIIFHFMSEERVDFRDLVRDLAHDYHTRIEMHQVGARDEARLVADYEICGRQCCCKNFLKKLHPVTMRMAKLQKATLDPSKVSGRCGRLRCCLRYEHEGYEELNAALPRSGVRIRTASGIGTIKDRHVLTQLLSVEYDDSGNIELVGLEEILESGLPKRPPPPPPAADSSDRYPDRSSRNAAGSPSGGREDSSRRNAPPRPRRENVDRSPPPAPPREAESDFDLDLREDGADDGAMVDQVDENAPQADTSSDQEAGGRESPDQPRRRRRRRGGRGRRGRNGLQPGEPQSNGGEGPQASGGPAAPDSPPRQDPP